MSRPKLLDLYCCQGGAGMGYRHAGFDVYGVDLDDQPRYPFTFRRADALATLDRLISGLPVRFFNHGMYRVTTWLRLSDFAAGHASPPCQKFTTAQRLQNNDHPDLIEPTRALLIETGLPYVIENVPGAPLVDPVLLCGPMFGLKTYRHRLFESNVALVAPPHREHVARTTKMGRAPRDGEFMHVVGNFSGVDKAREVMGMPWANRDGLREAIPPAYAEWIGWQLRAHIKKEKAA